MGHGSRKLHISGNDYISCFFNKGELTCLNSMQASPEFKNFFKELGNSTDVESYMELAELYVCRLYGVTKFKRVNEARYFIFHTKESKNISVDLSLLPPCKSVLYLHLSRAIYIANLWKQSLTAMVGLPEISEFGWNPDGSIVWVEECFPAEVEDIMDDLFSNTDNNDISYESDVDSEQE